MRNLSDIIYDELSPIEENTMTVLCQESPSYDDVFKTWVGRLDVELLMSNVRLVVLEANKYLEEQA